VKDLFCHGFGGKSEAIVGGSAVAALFEIVFVGGFESGFFDGELLFALGGAVGGKLGLNRSGFNQ